MDILNKYFISICVIVGAIIWMADPVDAQHLQHWDSTAVSTGMMGEPRIQRIDSRSVSMAGATMADANSIASMNINPALISFVDNLQEVQYEVYQNWNNNLIQQHLTSPAFRVRNHTFVFQGSATGSSFEYGNPYVNLSMPIPDISMYDVAMAYSFSINNILSFGVLNNISFANDEASDYTTFYADIGILYAPTDHLSYALSFRGIGNGIVYEFSGAGPPVLESTLLRQSLEIGTTLKFPAESDQPWMTLSFSNEKLFGIRGVWYKGGIELKPYPYLAFRSGLIFEPNDMFIAPRYGLGISTEYFRLDYSISPKQVFHKRFHQLSLILRF